MFTEQITTRALTESKKNQDFEYDFDKVVRIQWIRINCDCDHRISVNNRMVSSKHHPTECIQYLFLEIPNWLVVHGSPRYWRSRDIGMEV